MTDLPVHIAEKYLNLVPQGIERKIHKISWGGVQVEAWIDWFLISQYPYSLTVPMEGINMFVGEFYD